MEKKKDGLKVPHTFVLLFAMVVFCAILTFVVPAGAYDRITDEDTGRSVVDTTSFELVEQNGVGFFDMMLNFHEGMVASSSIIFLIFILGGSFMILQDTGALNAGVFAMATKYGKNQNAILILFIFLFSVLGGTIGMAEEVIVFIPLIVTLCKELKLDRMVALAVVMVGARVGFTTGLINPFTVGVAQGLADLPLYSGLWYRMIWYVIILIFTIWYTLRYANKIKKDPTASIMYGVEVDENDEVGVEIPLTAGRKIVIGAFFATIAIMVFGVFEWGWYITEISTIFLILGILAGVICRMGPSEIAKSFIKGAKDMVFAALVVGVARAILLTLEDGMIIDSVVYYASSMLGELPKVVAANGMFLFQLLLNVLIPSGSGQAAATMPIMAPLADTLGITRQTAVLAFHYGDGFTNLVAPTLGSLMASIAVSKVPLEKYLKWIAPLFAVWVVIGFISVTIATLINYGPF